MSQCWQHKLSQYAEARGALDPPSVLDPFTEVLRPLKLIEVSGNTKLSKSRLLRSSFKKKFWGKIWSFWTNLSCDIKLLASLRDNLNQKASKVEAHRLTHLIHAHTASYPYITLKRRNWIVKRLTSGFDVSLSCSTSFDLGDRLEGSTVGPSSGWW